MRKATGGADFQTWPAPAKLNLMLRVVGRRADGYHELQTVFQFLDWGDELRLRARADGRIHRLREVSRIPVEQDLVVRAARLLQEHSGTALGADLHLEKRIPLGGGLGGGSSDAATALVALNVAWGLGYGLEELADFGLRLGADVPVFVHGRAAWAEGVGERLTPLELPERWYLVIVPPVAVSTAEVFQDPELTRNSPLMTIADFLSAGGGNDCEAVVRERYPQVDRALGWLAEHGEARLTGTGACVFAAFDTETDARAVLAKAPRDLRGFVARGRNRSPLHERGPAGGSADEGSSALRRE